MRIQTLALAVFLVAFSAGCGRGATDEPGPPGPPPEAITPSPDMVSPEERARGGGGEGS